IVSKLQGPVDPAVPPFVGLSPRTKEWRWGNPGDPGYLGMPHAPYTPFRADSAGASEPGFSLDHGRLGARKSLLEELASLRRELDTNEAVGGLDACTRCAFDILTSGKLFQALDVSREDPRVRARYGLGDMTHEADGPPCCNDHFLMARRLVEAGV